MATYYSQSSGVWSSLTRWDTNPGGGESDPASVAAMEDSLFVIQADHVIDFDIDTSAWTVGFQTITITGHDTTPGVLRCDSTTLAAGTYNVKMKAGFSIVGSAAAVTEHGRILANSDGAWATTTVLANDRKFIISTVGTTSSTVVTIDATHLNIRLFCKQPALYDYVEVYGVPFVVTFANATEKFTIVSPTNSPAIPPNGTPIILSGTVPAELTAGTTYFVKAVSGATGELEATIGGGTIAITDDGSGTIYMHYGCWGPVAQATNVNTTTGVITWNGVPPAEDTPVRVKSSVTLPTGLTAYDLYYVRTISGNTCKLSLISGSDAGIVIPSAVGTGNISMYVGSSYTNSKVVNVIQDVTTDWVATAGGNGGNVVLYNYGPANSDQQRDTIATYNALYLKLTTNNINSAQYPLARIYLAARNVALRSTSTGTQPIVGASTGGIFQCEIRKSSGTGTIFAGYGLYISYNNTVSGVISGCSYLIRSGGVVSATLISVNTTTSPAFYDRNTTNYSMRIACENWGRSEGSMKIYEMFGDIVKTACDGTGDAPSVDPDGGTGNCIEVSNVQSNLGIPTGAIYPNVLPIFTNHRIWMTAASHTVTYKVQTTFAGITAGNLILTARYISTGGALAEITNAPAINTRADDTDWTQTLAVTFEPVRAGWVDFKMVLQEYESGNEVYVWPTPVIS